MLFNFLISICFFVLNYILHRYYIFPAVKNEKIQSPNYAKMEQLKILILEEEERVKSERAAYLKHVSEVRLSHKKMLQEKLQNTRIALLLDNDNLIKKYKFDEDVSEVVERLLSSISAG